MKLLKDYSASEQTALKNEICPDATDDQINYFLRVCEAKAVDPFSGLLYMQLRMNNKTKRMRAMVQPTVDGSRAAAARTNYYAGSDEPEFDNDDADHPNWCRVTVYRMVKGERCAFSAKCRWKEFVPQAPNDFQWRSKPYHMLGKVTEVQALRKAFPETVSASNEDESDTIVDDGQPPAPEDKIPAALAAEWANAVQAFADLGKKESDLVAYLNVAKHEVTREHLDNLRTWYNDLATEAEPKTVKNARK